MSAESARTNEIEKQNDYIDVLRAAILQGKPIGIREIAVEVPSMSHVNN